MELEERLVKLLFDKGFTVATAESCTGGLIAGAIVNVAGASKVFNEGYITYSNDAKEKLLRVSRETLEHFGAVSHDTAKEMALGAARAAGAQVGISSTGIAGPDGGTLEKPVGLVYLGISVCGTAEAVKFMFPGNRIEVRRQAVEAALSLAIEKISEKCAETCKM